MDQLPKVLEDLILDYKAQLEHSEKTKKVQTEFLKNIAMFELTNDVCNQCSRWTFQNKRNNIEYYQPEQPMIKIYFCDDCFYECFCPCCIEVLTDLSFNLQ